MTRDSVNIGVFGARAIPSTYSGYETFLTTLLPALTERGHKVTMYCRRGETSGRGPYRDVQRVVLPAIPGKQFNTLSHGAIASLRARLAQHDVVLAVNVANAFFCALHRYTGRPIVLNTDGQEWLRGKWGRVARVYFHSSARFAGQCATALVSDCNAMADVYRDEFDADSSVIPYCVPAHPLASGTGICTRLGVDSGEFFIVAARLNPENHVDAIADAYARTSFKQQLLVLGTANYRSPVETNLHAVADRDPRVRVIGHVDNRDEFFELLGAARGYIHGHSVGGMNPSLVEAMHAGALVTALDTPFNRETLGDAGRYFELDDVEGALQCLLDEPDDVAAELRDRARRRAAARYDTGSIVDAYERLLIAAAHASARSPLVVPTRWSTA
jgi:glycosyltransferase involved in cell wall biosynthesis